MTIDWTRWRERTQSTGWNFFAGHPSAEEIEVVPLPSSTCRVTSRPHQGSAVFGLQGELDVATSGEVRGMLSSAIGEAEVVFDLTEVTVVDVEGVEALRDVIRCVHEEGGRIAISRPWRLARPILDLIGVDGLVYLALSPLGATEWFNQHPRTVCAPDGVGDGELLAPDSEVRVQAPQEVA